MRRVGTMLAALALAATPAAAAVRIVSTNPCADAVLMQVADPGQILAISHYSQDARATSIPLAQARRFRATGGSAEDLIALRPDLVIGDTLMAPSTVAALGRLKIPLVRLPVPESLAESRAQVAEIARVTGHDRRGAALNRRIDAAVAAARPATGMRPLPALIWQGGGLALGPATLADELLRRTGFVNHASAYAMGKWGVVSIEALVARPPRVLLTGDGSGGDAGRQLRHPALRALGRRVAVRTLPSWTLQCGGPSIIAAVRSLAATRRGLGRM